MDIPMDIPVDPLKDALPVPQPGPKLGRQGLDQAQAGTPGPGCHAFIWVIY